MARIKSIWSILVGILREISDESAYQRHLDRHGSKHSGQEYRKFAECRLRQKYQQAKCC